jgi:hypothetical protein
VETQLAAITIHDAPVVMVAEKGADLVLGRAALAADLLAAPVSAGRNPSGPEEGTAR